MTTRAIGDVRPSQVITTFGPGAIVDLQTLSVIVAGIDRWPTDERRPLRIAKPDHITQVAVVCELRADGQEDNQ